MIKLSKNRFFFKKGKIKLGFKIKDDTFLRLHEQIYLMRKNSEMCDRKEWLFARFNY